MPNYFMYATHKVCTFAQYTVARVWECKRHRGVGAEVFYASLYFSHIHTWFLFAKANGNGKTFLSTRLQACETGCVCMCARRQLLVSCIQSTCVPFVGTTFAVLHKVTDSIWTVLKTATYGIRFSSLESNGEKHWRIAACAYSHLHFAQAEPIYVIYVSLRLHNFQSVIAIRVHW